MMSIIVIINHQIKRGDGDHNHFDDGDMMIIRMIMMIMKIGITDTFPFHVFFLCFAKTPKDQFICAKNALFPPNWRVCES